MSSPEATLPDINTGPKTMMEQAIHLYKKEGDKLLPFSQLVYYSLTIIIVEEHHQTL